MAGPVYMDDKKKRDPLMDTGPRVMAIADVARSRALREAERDRYGPRKGPPGEAAGSPQAAAAGTPGMAGPTAAPDAAGAATTPGTAPPGMLGQPPGVTKPVDIQEWTRRNHPFLSKMPVVDPRTAKMITDGHQNYVALELATQRLAQGAAANETSRTEINRRIANDEERRARGAQGKNDIPVPAELIEQYKKDLAAGNMKSEAVQTVMQLYGVDAGSRSSGSSTHGSMMAPLEDAAIAELLNGVVGGPAWRTLQRVRAPSAGQPPRLGRELAELMAGDPAYKMPGLADKIHKNPVAGWIEASRVLGSAVMAAHPDDQAAVVKFLGEHRPTAVQVIEARDAGRITPQEAADVLAIILSPMELEQIQAGAKPEK